ncbi:MAG: hypothetical protein DMF56_27615 [Acidobacteria bacterium]|nr:MAG: hypothetical protein DMF56_27615 [Acidobacteriota bacterium]
MKTRAVGFALTIAGVFLVLAPWLPQGLDLTDDGWHLANQQQLLMNGWKQEDPSACPMWLSDVVGAAWLRVAGMGLLEARIGWLVLACITAAISFLILSRDFPPASTAAALIAAALVIHSQGRLLIDYNVVPSLFLLAACGLLLMRGRGERASRPPMHVGRDARRVRAGRPLSSALTAFLSGVCIALAAAARLPCIIGVLLPWTIVALRRRDSLNAVLSNAGTLLTLGAIYVLTPYDPAIAETQKYWGPSHGVGSLMAAYSNHAIKVIVLAAVLVWMSMRRPAWIAGLGAAVVPLVLLWPSPTLVYGFALAGVAVVIAALVQAMRTRVVDRKMELLVLGLLAALAGCIGSNNGLSKMRYGLWLALPAAFLMLVERAQPRNRKAMWTAVAMLALIGGAVRWISPYRDADRLQLTAPIDHPRLRGIYTSRNRAAELESLLRELQKHVRPGDSMIAFGSIPMLHFLTATRPALGYAWPDFLSEEPLRARLDRSVPPAIVVEGITDPAAPQTRAFEEWRARNGYRVIWRGVGWVVWGRGLRIEN